MSADYKGRALCDLSVLTTFSPDLDGDQRRDRHPETTNRDRSWDGPTNRGHRCPAGATVAPPTDPGPEFKI
ncbi:hypothetical protein GCM10009687_14950 [Asanoa iriomotensis]